MKVVFAADHAGFELKAILKPFVVSLGYDIEDVGADTFDSEDDFVPFIQAAARMVAEDPEHTSAIVLGGSGQGEAIAANRFKGVRAVVYYGELGQSQTDASGTVLDMIGSVRNHNNANVLSLGARFLSESQAKNAVKKFLAMPFSGVPRHIRRIKQIDENL